MQWFGRGKADPRVLCSWGQQFRDVSAGGIVLSADLWRKYIRQGRRLINFALVNFFKLTLAVQLLKEKGSLPLVMKGFTSSWWGGEVAMCS